MSLTYNELKTWTDNVDIRANWDVPRAHDRRDPVPWDYEALVPRYLLPSDLVLDIGTGNGEQFLDFETYFAQGFGIDIDSDRIAQARQNQINRGSFRIIFGVMDAHHLELKDASFDAILSRHCPVDVAEVARVLRPGGLFITQQVAPRNAHNLLEAFGWTSDSLDVDWWQSTVESAAEFQSLGCHVVTRAEYNVRHWFADVTSLLSWLQSGPCAGLFDLEEHWQDVNYIVDTYTTECGIETNECRELLIVRKG